MPTEPGSDAARGPTGPVPQRTLASLHGNPRSVLAKTIPRRPRVSLWLGLVLAFVFAALAVPAITADRWVASIAGPVTAGAPAPITVRVPALAGFETAERRFGTGGIVIARGHVATVDDAANAAAVSAATPNGALPYAALFLIPFVLAAIFTHHMRRSTRGRLVRVQVVSLAAIVVIAIAVKVLLLATAVSALVVPVALLSLVATMALDRVVGLATGVLAALVVGLLGPFDVGVAIVLLVQAATAGLVVDEQPKDRIHAVVVAGSITTLCTAGAYVLLSYLSTGALPTLGDPLHSPWFAALLGPVIAGVLAVPLVPLYQILVGEITRAKLVELDDQKHPLLVQIADKAPGSWQHSLAMANLAETAANAIGASARLVRVGALFHDLGKSLQPKYFIENLDAGEVSPHDKLAPEVSTDAIFAHVTEGIVAARRAGLHERIVDFMHMHHGNGVLEYFWGKAQEQGNPNNFTVEDFRYPGHPPQSRETAILAICDAVEAASRTLKKPDAKAIDALVQRIVYGKLHLGQLDESGLSMADLRLLSAALGEAVRHANHSRIEYPWQREEAATGTQPRLDSLDRNPAGATKKPQLEILESKEIDPDVVVTRTPNLRDSSPSTRERPSSSPPPVPPARRDSGGFPTMPRAATSEHVVSRAAPRSPSSEIPALRSPSGEHPVVSRTSSSERPTVRVPSGEYPALTAATRAADEFAPTPLVPTRLPSGEYPASRPSSEHVVPRTRSSEMAAVRASEPRVSSDSSSFAGLNDGAADASIAASTDASGRTSVPRATTDHASSGRARASDMSIPAGLGRPRAITNPAIATESRGARAGTASELRSTSGPHGSGEIRGPSKEERLAASAATDPREWAAASPIERKTPPTPDASERGKPAPAAKEASSWTERGASDAPWPELAGEASEPVEAPGMSTLRGHGYRARAPGPPPDIITPATFEPRKRAATLPPVPSRRAPTVPPTPIPGRRPMTAPTHDDHARRGGPPLPTDLDNATTNPPPIRYGNTLVPASTPRPPALRAEILDEDVPEHVHTDATATGMDKFDADELFRVTDLRMEIPPMDENLRSTIPPDDAGRTAPSLPMLDEETLDRAIGDDTNPALAFRSDDVVTPVGGIEREEPRTNPAMRAFERPATRSSQPPAQRKSLASTLAARVDAQLGDEWGKETPINAPTSAELRNLLGQPDPTRQQSFEEIERLHRESSETETPEPDLFRGPRRPNPTTNEVDPDDIEAAIEIHPPARRPTSVAIAKPKKPE